MEFIFSGRTLDPDCGGMKSQIHFGGFSPLGAAACSPVCGLKRGENDSLASKDTSLRNPFMGMAFKPARRTCQVQKLVEGAIIEVSFGRFW